MKSEEDFSLAAFHLDSYRSIAIRKTRNLEVFYTDLFSAFLSRVSHLWPKHSISFATLSLSTDSASSATLSPSFLISSTVGFLSSSSLCKSCQRQTKEESRWPHLTASFSCLIEINLLLCVSRFHTSLLSALVSVP